MNLSKLKKTTIAAALLAGVSAFIPVQATPVLQQVKTVFVIAMENHNFKQPSPLSSPQQIFTNPAAPYINSLITPGHSNAVQVSYSTKYYNAGVGVHPSEPSYVWAEGGTDFGIHTDNEPRAAYNNVFTNNHLVRQLNTAGITWKNYQEDVQRAASPTNNSSGSSGAINPYYGTAQYDYAVKHNPMAFYTDTQIQNVSAFTNFLKDLTNNGIGRYNWITPNQFNDQHSALTGGYTYHSVLYTGDQAAIAQGDNFLSILVPKIMASAAYQDHGVIIIRWDETEGGDSTSYTIPEITISPLAKGNAYASSVELNHSSVIKTVEEIFGLTFLTNAIPASETKASGSGYNNVATVNDLSDMFQTAPGLVVQQAGTTLTNGGSAPAFGTVNVGASVTNTFTVTNSGSATLILSNLIVNGVNADNFTVSGITLPASVVVDGSVTFKVVFSPTAGGARSATLQITNNDASRSPFTLALTGVGNAAPVITVPATITVEATNANGNVVNFTVTANDAEDGVLTPVVNPASGSNFALGTNIVTATASDTHGFSVTNTFLVIIRDTTAPVITLNGANPLTVECHGSFTDPGATASDVVAGNVGVSVSSYVDPNTAGSYALTYTAGDGRGNTNSMIRTVNVTDTLAPVISWSFTNLTLNATSNCSALMMDVTGTNYILASDACDGSALTITQSPTNNAALAAGTTNQIIISVADSTGNTACSTNWIVVADVTAPVIVNQPVSRTNNAGTMADFIVFATACAQMNYQWYFGTNVLSGQTNSALSIASVGPANAGDYHVAITSTGGSTNSALATLTITYQAPNLVGGQMTLGADGFQLTFSGPSGQSYQVLAADDLTLPWSAWLVVASGTFSGTNVLFTDPSVTDQPGRFYTIRSP
jgi:hypothetical protein